MESAWWMLLYMVLIACSALSGNLLSLLKLAYFNGLRLRCSSGLILDAFLGSGTPNKPTSKYFNCDGNKVAVGFSARPNCYALTSFQVDFASKCLIVSIQSQILSSRPYKVILLVPRFAHWEGMTSWKEWKRLWCSWSALCDILAGVTWPQKLLGDRGWDLSFITGDLRRSRHYQPNFFPTARQCLPTSISQPRQHYFNSGVR